MAGIHRSSTLHEVINQLLHTLGMAGIHRSSTLVKGVFHGCGVLGMAGIHRSSTLTACVGASGNMLGMAGIHRSSTLVERVHTEIPQLGMAGIHRSSTLGRAELAEKQGVGAVSLLEKQDLVWNFLGFSRLSSIEHLHLAELVIRYGHQPDLSKRRNDGPDCVAVRICCFFAGQIPRIDRILQHHKSIFEQALTKARVVALVLRCLYRQVEHGNEPQ